MHRLYLDDKTKFEWNYFRHNKYDHRVRLAYINKKYDILKYTELILVQLWNTLLPTIKTETPFLSIKIGLKSYLLKAAFL